MPFQDTEDEPVQSPKPPSTIERWLRRIFVEDIGLKLLSLVITLLVWTAVTSENQPTTTNVAVPVNFVRPENLAISNDPPRTIEVLLTGSQSKLKNLRLLDLVATVDLTDSKTGDRVIRLSPERVSIALPTGVTIASFQPATLAIRLEPIVKREVSVDVHLDGMGAEGFEVYGTQATPATVWVSGPASHVQAIENAPTETVSLEGRQDSFTVSRVSVALPDEKLEVADGVVDVTVTIGPKRIEKRFENIPVRRSDNSTAIQFSTVTLLGPSQALEELKHEDIVVLVDRSPSGEQVPRLQLPAAVQQQVKLITINPPLSK